jgi:penicillin V acylase-like amidase (Ntn superfamily)
MRPKHLITCIISLIIFEYAYGCTTFVLSDEKGHIVFGKNFDFPIAEGHIQINYKNTEKTSFFSPPEIPLTWVSKYGSITFNQAGREFPYGGINEAGLVIEQMWLQETKYPGLDHRHGLNELQWIQYQLDNFATVNEVIQSDSLVRISTMAVSYLHFLVSDAAGNVAAIEYIDGNMLVRKNDNLPYKVLANCPYQHSLDYKTSIENNKAEDHNEWTKNSSGRFARAAGLIQDYSEKDDIIDYSFNILNSVSQPGNTQWSIVYDPGKLKVYYKSSLRPERQMIDMHLIDFSCSSQNLYMPVDEKFSGIDHFRNLTYEDNLGMLELIFNGIEFLKNAVSPEYMSSSAEYYTGVTCTD